MEERIAHAAGRHAVLAALHQTIGDGWVETAQVQRDGTSCYRPDEISIIGIDLNRPSERQVIVFRSPVVGRVLGVVPPSEETGAESGVQSQMRQNLPVVLDVELPEFIAGVVLPLPAVLRITLDSGLSESCHQ